MQTNIEKEKSQADTNNDKILTALNKLVRNFKDRYSKNYKMNFAERNTVISSSEVEDFPLTNNFNINPEIMKEVNFYNKTLLNAKKALLKIKSENVKIFRPKDFYAEMFKDDDHMDKVKVVLEKKKRKIQTVEKKKRDL